METVGQRTKRSKATQETIRQAKLELISSILKARQSSGEEVYGRDFDSLIDMDMDELYMTEVKETDRIYQEKKGMLKSC
jgi:hypothetical protein